MPSTSLPPGFPKNATPSPGIPKNATPNPTVGETVRASEEIGTAVDRAQEYTKARIAQAGEESQKLVASQLRGGAQKISPTSMKGEALLGRNSNIDTKRKFKSGAVARVDPNAGSTRAAKKKKGMKQS